MEMDALKLELNQQRGVETVVFPMGYMISQITDVKRENKASVLPHPVSR